MRWRRSPKSQRPPSSVLTIDDEYRHHSQHKGKGCWRCPELEIGSVQQHGQKPDANTDNQGNHYAYESISNVSRHCRPLWKSANPTRCRGVVLPQECLPMGLVQFWVRDDASSSARRQLE